MTQTIIVSFLVGLIGSNGIPHFVKGISGEKHMTPFGRPSSAMVNVVWGWVNFVVAGILWYYTNGSAHKKPAFAFIVTGVLINGLFLAYYWARHPENNGKK